MHNIKNLSNKPPINTQTNNTFKVGIDKISVVRQFESDQHSEDVRGVGYSLAINNSEFLEVKNNGSLYRATYKAHGPLADEYCLIQFDPYNKKNGPLRIEFNPFKQGQIGIDYIKGIADNFLDYGYPELLKFGRVSRLDVAVDIVGVDIEQLQVLPSTGVTSAYYARKGHIESIYYGRKNSLRRIRIYNKLIEDNALSSDVPITRIEQVIKNSGMLENISSITPPMKGLNIGFWPKCPVNIKSHDWAGFISLAKLMPLPAALALQPIKKRNIYRKALKQEAHPQWSAKSIHAEYQAYVAQCGIFSSGYSSPLL